MLILAQHDPYYNGSWQGKLQKRRSKSWVKINRLHDIAFKIMPIINLSSSSPKLDSVKHNTLISDSQEANNFCLFGIFHYNTFFLVMVSFFASIWLIACRASLNIGYPFMWASHERLATLHPSQTSSAFWTWRIIDKHFALTRRSLSPFSFRLMQADEWSDSSISGERSGNILPKKSVIGVVIKTIAGGDGGGGGGGQSMHFCVKLLLVSDAIDKMAE